MGVGFGKSRGLGQVTADFTGLVVRYPTAQLLDDGLRILGHQEPTGRADELLGFGAFVAGEEGYGLPANDRMALPPDMRLQTNDWGEVELALKSAGEIEALWRTAAPAWRRAIGVAP